MTLQKEMTAELGALQTSFMEVQASLHQEREKVAEVFTLARKAISDLEQVYHLRLNERINQEQGKHKQMKQTARMVQRLAEELLRSSADEQQERSKDRFWVLRTAQLRNQIQVRIEETLS